MDTWTDLARQRPVQLSVLFSIVLGATGSPRMPPITAVTLPTCTVNTASGQPGAIIMASLVVKFVPTATNASADSVQHDVSVSIINTMNAAICAT